MNCSPWTVALVVIWTCQTLPSYSKGKSIYRKFSPLARFNPSPFPPKTLDDDFDKRFWFITALVFVMERWKGEKPDMLAGDLFDMQLSPDSAMVLENIVAKYYCQQFFNYFGRAAQVPHHLFVTNPNCLFATSRS